MRVEWGSAHSDEWSSSSKPIRRNQFPDLVHLATATSNNRLASTVSPSKPPALSSAPQLPAMASHQRQSDFGIHEVRLELACADTSRFGPTTSKPSLLPSAPPWINTLSSLWCVLEACKLTPGHRVSRYCCTTDWNIQDRIRLPLPDNAL